MLTNAEFEEKMARRRMTIEGAEVPDPKPVAPPVGFVKQPSMFEQVRKMMAQEMARLRNDDVETPQDAADMGEDEDDDLIERLSQYERYDLEMELARRTDLENARQAQEAAQAEVSAPPSDGPGAKKTAQKPPQAADGGKKAPVDQAGEE